MSEKVQNASTHPLGRKNHEHVHSSRSVQGPVQGGDGTLHAQVWAMDSIWRKTHEALPRHTTNSEQTIGAMEEMSQKVQNANTHILRRQNHAHTRAATSQFKSQVKLEGVR